MLTQPINPNLAVIGYIINSGISDTLYAEVKRLQDKLQAAVPSAVWLPPRDSLHITLLDWTAPLVHYEGQDKDKLFESLRPSYVPALQEVLAGQSPIKVSFDTVEVHPGAVIIKGQDDGSYQRIREAFLSKVTLLPGTKQPPTIVHSTIAKFVQAIDLQTAQAPLQGETLAVDELVTEFRLVRETKIFLTDFRTLEAFRLQS